MNVKWEVLESSEINHIVLKMRSFISAFIWLVSSNAHFSRSSKCKYIFLHLTYRMRQHGQSKCSFSYFGQNTTLCLLYPLCVDVLALTSDQFIDQKWDLRSRDPFITILPTQNLLHGNVCLVRLCLHQWKI